MTFLAMILWFTVAGLVLASVAMLTMLPSRYVSSPGEVRVSTSVQILVLGDIGRSPRMQYHALSIAKHGCNVHLVGYLDSSPHPELIDNPRVTIHALTGTPKALMSSAIPFVVAGPLKVLWQIFAVIRVLGYTTPPSTWLLVQNPPTIPTLAVGWAISLLRNTDLMVDWHNYGWTILAGTKGHTHPLVKVSKSYECILGEIVSTANITVTHAMKAELQGSPYNITSPIHVLHDRPAAIFQPLKHVSERKQFLEDISCLKDFSSSILAGTTRLMVSSTSWTPDEDFSLLLDALVTYAKADAAVPIVAVITGKGPQKEYYERRIRELFKAGKLPNICIMTTWLSLENYARLLSCADLGVCLHMSSSGVDLPMKVVDMFGAGLPVVAYSGYKSIDELVLEGTNGYGFETADELSHSLLRLLGDSGRDQLAHIRQGAEQESHLRWDQEWDRVLAPVFGFSG
ncbi:glycosyltransferase family 33 protein [Xylariaceae sp. FL1019]|nr:glycosyltransferase family 33 protein [Xylariaceae sp. FL1019]